MLFRGWKGGAIGLLLALALQVGMGASGAAPDSDRLGRAKDYIADEQWVRAIAELRAAAADPKEAAKDEALYWLAHSLNQGGDAAAAIATIRRLEREYPRSLWVKPAGSLRLDIAVHMQRNDVLWWTAVPPPPPPPPPAAPAVAGAPAPPLHPTPPEAPRRRSRLAPPPPPASPPVADAPDPAVEPEAAGSSRTAGRMAAGVLPARHRSAYSGARQPDADRRQQGHSDPQGDCARERQLP